MAAETREIRDRILAECDRQYQSVRFGHEFGKWISTGIRAARIAIESIPAELEPAEFLRRALSVLDSVRRDVDNPNDEDGWTLGGVGTIARAILDERLALERANASSREGILAAVDDVVRDALPDRYEVLRRQVAMLLLDTPPTYDHTGIARGTCAWCRAEGDATRLPGLRQVCRACARLFAANLDDATDGRNIPAPGMVIADVARALRHAGEPGAERIITELERRATVRRSHHPRGFLPACDGCGNSFERCRWTASLPGVDVCDDCIRLAREGGSP